MLGGSVIAPVHRPEVHGREPHRLVAKVASDAETSTYVEELERRVDMMEAEDELPSGDTLAAELTRFLRERERGNGGPERGPSEQP